MTARRNRNSPVTWEEQTQIAVDRYNAGATLLHIHVRDPKTGHISKDFNQYNEQLARVRKAVPKMILQMGGSISFASEGGEDAGAASYDTRHKLCTLSPSPDQITVMCGSGLFEMTATHPVDAFDGTRFTNPAMSTDGQSGDGCDARLLPGKHQAVRGQRRPALFGLDTSTVWKSSSA